MSILTWVSAYSAFLSPYKTLSTSNPDVVGPPVPHFGGTCIQQRRLAIVKCVNSMVNHPVLVKDPELKKCRGSETFSLEIKHSKAKISHDRG
jgi:sorting nexin-1/2